MKILKLIPSLLLLVFGINVVTCELRTVTPETSELCPKITGTVQRYHNKTRKCYEVGSRGPCGEMMTFYADPLDADVGECDCDNKLRCHRPLIYWPETDRCYLAFEQGPCEATEWLAFNYHYTPSCRANPCIASNLTEFEDSLEQGADEDSYWILAKGGECVKTNTQGFCHYPNEVVALNGFARKVKPFCAVVTSTCTTPVVPSLFCAPGQRWSAMGMCNIKCKKQKKRGHSSRRHHRPRRPLVYRRRFAGRDEHSNLEVTTTILPATNPVIPSVEQIQPTIPPSESDENEIESDEDLWKIFTPAEVAAELGDFDSSEEELGENDLETGTSSTTTEQPAVTVGAKKRGFKVHNYFTRRTRGQGRTPIQRVY